VGIAGVTCDCAEVETILADAALRQQYVDRIIQRCDVSRLDSPVVRDCIRTAIGAYPSLAPEIAKAIEKFQEQI
jgi:hypothetical protein